MLMCRDRLARSVNCGSVSFLCLALVAAASTVPPRNVIFLIGDGMGAEQVTAGRYFHGAPLSFEALPYQGWSRTADLNGSVTDSAAAATAMATGEKVVNGQISQTAGGELVTSLEMARDAGKATGLVTTTYITHATPAAFGAHELSRSSYAAIASDYFDQVRPNVLMGGAKHLSIADALAAGYAVATHLAGLLTVDTDTTTFLSGQFGSDHMPYEYDGLGTLPHLSEMTTVALDILDNDPDGFFLLVEGGRIDHASHDNDITRTVQEVIEFSNTVQTALDWSAGRTDTLVIVTADHETGGLTVTGDNDPGADPSVTWSTGGHTGVNVPVYAWGTNADKVSGTLDNTFLFTVTTTPEPATVFLLSALSLLLSRRRR